MSIRLVDKSEADLKGIISVGDYINHSIFTLDEIKNGLEKLISIDYVSMVQNRFFTSKTFNWDYKKLKTHPKVMLKEVDQLYDLLKIKTFDEVRLKSLRADIINWKLLKSAYEEYVK